MKFTGSATGIDKVKKWRWDLGNGTIVNTRNPKFIYRRPGNYTVTLTVTGTRAGRNSHQDRRGLHNGLLTFEGPTS